MKLNVLRLVLAAILAAGSFGSGCAPGTRSAPTPAGAKTWVFPGESWQPIAPAQSAGWSRAGLDSVRARLSAMPSTAFTAIVGGRVLLEYGDVRAISYLASVRKSVLSMLVGIYVAQGKLDLGRTLADLGMDDVGGLTEAERQATVRHLLMARSGVYHEASNAGDDLASAPPRGSQPPGTYFLYSNWDFNALGAAFELQTGRDIYDALAADLARPIGMQDFDRGDQRKSGDTTRSRYLAYHMYLSTRDMARLGYLMLREGNWAGRQLIPREWVRASTRAITKVSEMNPPARRAGPFGYGYLWWVWDGPHATGAYEGAFTGLGAVGQHITVLPKLDLVVAHKTRPGDGRRVTHPEYLTVLEQLVRAHCGSACAAAPTR
jgi:CubicO group peptidase (beta-lactamase class C family)